MINQTARLLATASFLIAYGIPGATAAPAADPNHKIVDTVEIYLGVLSAEQMREEYSKERGETAMHGGIPGGPDYYHVNVSLFDTRTHGQIANAQVMARVEQVGARTEAKRLEATKINNTVSYGGYFRMGGKNPYWITVEIRIPGSAKAITARFEHRNY